METNCEYISYESTGYFSKIILDYLKGDEKLQPFYNYAVSIEGIHSSIEARKKYTTPRALLVQELRKQYAGIEFNSRQAENLEALLLENTFTICTAHQPNIFTGHLYFIYKILHAIKLADHLKNTLPENNFVPIYYMGSEDADLDELGHIKLNGEKLEWKTRQTGAVGRMKVDQELIKLVDVMAGQLEVLEHGKDLIYLLRSAYKEGITVQQSTLILVNELFRSFGLLILIPDNGNLKRHFNSIVKKELVEQFSAPLVEEATNELSKSYKAQASGREINLFYLTDSKRERIEKESTTFKVVAEKIAWTEDEVVTEVDDHPERFSANVILRGVFQEMILPNIAFIGGGGEVAYWLELKKVFEACSVPYPMLIVRNSFLLINKTQKEVAEKFHFSAADLFKSTHELTKQVVKKKSELQVQLTAEKEQLNSFYKHLNEISGKVDPTLSEHVKALQVKALARVNALEKKLLKAETKKFDAQQRQITKLKASLFPNENLQERVENFSAYHAMYGKDWLNTLYDSSLTLEQELCILQLPQDA